MELINNTATWWVPDGKPEGEARRRVTHRGIGAQEDDLEFMAFHGILFCCREASHGFGEVTCSNRTGGARTGPFAYGTDEEMQALRIMDPDKVAKGMSGNDALVQALNGVFASQIAGGKRYDLATLGRRRANAAFFESHGVDEADLKDTLRHLNPDT